MPLLLGLKINIFLWKLLDTFLIRQRTIYKKKIWIFFLFNIQFYFPKMGKTVFDLYKFKIIFFEFHFIFSFNKNLRICSPCRRLQKGYKKNSCWFSSNSPYFQRPCLRPRKEATLWHAILELGSNNNLAQHSMCNIFFSKPLHPTEQCTHTIGFTQLCYSITQAVVIRFLFYFNH